MLEFGIERLWNPSKDGEWEEVIGILSTPKYRSGFEASLPGALAHARLGNR